MIRNIDFVKVFVLQPDEARWFFPQDYEEGEWIVHPQRFWRYRRNVHHIELNVWCGRIVNQSPCNLLDLKDRDFYYKCIDALVSVYKEFNIPEDCIPSTMELGNTIKIGKEARPFIESILSFGNTAVFPIARRRRRLGVKAKRCHRIYKLYIKKGHYLNFEIKFLRKRELQVMRIHTLSDLKKENIKLRLDTRYISAWNKFITLPYIPKAPMHMVKRKKFMEMLQINKHQVKLMDSKERYRLKRKIAIFERKEKIVDLHRKYRNALSKLPKKRGPRQTLFEFLKGHGIIEYEFMLCGDSLCMTDVRVSTTKKHGEPKWIRAPPMETRRYCLRPPPYAHRRRRKKK